MRSALDESSRGFVQGTPDWGVHFTRGLVEGSGFIKVYCTGERQARENICDYVILASLVFDLEVIFRKAKDPAFNPGGRGQISPKKIAKWCVLSTQEKFLAKQKHSEMLNGAHHCVELEFIRSVVAL